jgi:hypothetical protein
MPNIKENKVIKGTIDVRTLFPKSDDLAINVDSIARRKETWAELCTRPKTYVRLPFILGAINFETGRDEVEERNPELFGLLLELGCVLRTIRSDFGRSPAPDGLSAMTRLTHYGNLEI